MRRPRDPEKEFLIIVAGALVLACVTIGSVAYLVIELLQGRAHI